MNIEFLDDNEMPDDVRETFRIAALPEVRDAVQRMSRLCQGEIFSNSDYSECEPTGNPFVTRQGILITYINDHLPPAEQYTVWVDDLELIFTLEAILFF
jgi:hypothetical protein